MGKNLASAVCWTSTTKHRQDSSGQELPKLQISGSFLSLGVRAGIVLTLWHPCRVPVDVQSRVRVKKVSAVQQGHRRWTKFDNADGHAFTTDSSRDLRAAHRDDRARVRISGTFRHRTCLMHSSVILRASPAIGCVLSTSTPLPSYTPRSRGAARTRLCRMPLGGWRKMWK